MKLLISSKIVTFLLLSVFLFAGTGNAFGYAWCVGDDGHVEVNYISGGDCCADDSSNRDVDRYDVTAISHSDGEHCGLCLDSSAKPSEAIFLKRLKRTSTVSIATVSLNNFPSPVLKGSKLLAGNRATLSLPRVSQAILAHRTVVLLN